MRFYVRLTINLAALSSGICLIATAASSHEAKPNILKVRERDNDLVTVQWEPSSPVGNNGDTAWRLSPTCNVLNKLSANTRELVNVSCRGGIRGKSLQIVHQMGAPQVETLIHVETKEGDEFFHLLSAQRADWRIPQQPSIGRVAQDYARLGAQHIWSGIDHLLFVGGLIMLAGGIKRILMALTGFTVGHSITLGLSVMDVIRVPVPPTEAAIALSVMFLARELVDNQPGTFSKRSPVLVACCFGLLHGLGFATALLETGLPSNHIVLGLGFFNLGVELGQIAFVIGLLIVWRIFGVLMTKIGPKLDYASGTRRAVGFILGCLACSWFIERMLILL